MRHVVKGRTKDGLSYLGYCGFTALVIDAGYGEAGYTLFPDNSDCAKCKYEDRLAHEQARNLQTTE